MAKKQFYNQAPAADSSSSDIESGSATPGSDDAKGGDRPPTKDDIIFGIDKRPLLPVVLAVCLLLDFLYRLLSAQSIFVGIAIVVFYVVGLYCAGYAALSDPGQIDVDAEDPLPRRAHRSWQYSLPVLRYDHYCRWMINTIGLWNHREFIATLVFLVVSGYGGTFQDVWMLVNSVMKGRAFDCSYVVTILHLGYCSALLYIVLPIFNIHRGLVSRNETSLEWKKNNNYVVEKDGHYVSVNDLDTDEFNEKFESFIYDRTRNPWDQGLSKNCWSFWCTARTEDELGEF